MKNSSRFMVLGGVFGITLSLINPVFAGSGPWKSADTNKDGFVDRAEFDAQGVSRFQKIDSNTDGFLTQDEFRAKYEATKADRVAKMVKRFDKDSDGKLSEAEWPEKHKVSFTDADTNKDGVVTADELIASRKAKNGGVSDGKDRMARLDGDKDGKISATEWSAQGEKMFVRWDTNKDGKIEESELPKHGKRDHSNGEKPVMP